MQAIQRLTDLFTPESYQLSLDLKRIERTFSGTVILSGKVPGGVDYIKLHAKDLSIESAAVDGKTVQIEYGDNDEITLRHPDIAVGLHVIVISFSGTITDAMHGLYPCYYQHDGVKKELLATQFESHHAREVFPCIDEPAGKATFDVTLTTEANISVLGNMPVTSQQIEHERLVTKFEQSPKMSPYLLAFVTGELQKKSARTSDGVDVSIWSTPAQPIESLDFALDIAVRSIEFYNDYFGTAYPLPKSDHVALPDFTVGAMENWGLITYRETTLLAEPNMTSIASKQYIATVIAHELAHQWFGNLVTMQWWNYLWLNESFATLMEYIAVNALHPEWEVWLDFAGNEAVMALRRDSLAGVQPVQLDVNHPDEISTLFDGAIVYAKGARLLRMVQSFIGDTAFQDGLQQYFKDFAYANTTGADLWNALSKSSGQDIAALMDTWVSTPGYPVVSVSIHDDIIQLEQRQFFIGPHDAPTQLWPLPLGSNDETWPKLMTDKVLAAPTNPGELVKLNGGDTAHFITQYDAPLFTRLVEAIKNDQLTPLDRMQILNESMLLARASEVSSGSLIELLAAFSNETSEPVWSLISMTLSELKKFVETDPVAERRLRELSARTAAQQYKRLGWEQAPDEPESDTKLRSLIIGLTLYGEDPQAITMAQTMFRDNALSSIDAELRPLIISTTVRHGEPELVDELLAMYRQASSGELRQDICLGITSTRHPEKIQLLLDTMKDTRTIRPQDTARWFVYLIRNRDAREAAWQWLQDNWQWIEKTFSGDKSYDDYPRASAGALTTARQLEQYSTFFADKKSIPALSRVIAIGEAEIEGRVTLIERDGPAVRATLLAL